MKSKAKKIIGGLLAATMLFSSIPAPAGVQSFSVVTEAASGISMYDATGWYESAYVKWSPVSGAALYKAYIKGSSGSYTQLDDPLIRNYGSYWRADAVGLAAGSYTMKVEAYSSNGSLIGSAEKSGLSVSSYDRSGSAFSSKSTYGTGSGAYNDDGTLRSGAQVIYITPETAKTVTADVISDAKGKITTYTGFQNIINGLQKGYDTRGFDFRIVGLIDAKDMDSFGSSAEGLQLKGKSAYSRMNVTIEGIGEDAAIRGFGILIRNAGNIEIRNFGIMLCMDDALSLDTSNCNVWVHNMDCYYGNTGGDADQAKGDGTMDVKSGSTFVTFSYNHFWDNGKSSLCGMKSEKTDYFITYHHNWFDHSDSRHPRIRTMSVHIYNNYFDSCAKYGVGMTMGGSAFVEQNYFLDTTKPMMISGQGTDASGAGTFSGEAGGVIKAYNNKFEFSKVSSSKLSYKTQNNSSTDFDAIEVTSRNAKVDSSYKAKSGGSTYNNFDTSWDLGVKNMDSVSNVPSVVMANAGRMNGGDFPANRNSFSVINDASSYSVDSSFKNAMASYKSPVVSIGGSVNGAQVVVTTTKATTTEKTTETTTAATTKAATTTTKAATTTTKAATTTTKAPVTEKPTETTTKAVSSSGAVAMGTYNLNSSTVSGKTATYANMTFNVRSVESTCVKLRSDNSITFKVDKACKLTAEVSGKGISVAGTTTGTGTVSVDLKAGTYTITGIASGSNSAISKLTFAASSSEKTTEATTTTAKTTTKTTTTKTTTTKTTTTEKQTETTTKASSGSGSISFGTNSMTVKRGQGASFNVNASGAYYIEHSGASWWFESNFLNVWGSNADKRLTDSTQSFGINQWCGLQSGYTFTLTAHLSDNPSKTATLKVTVE